MAGFPRGQGSIACVEQMEKRTLLSVVVISPRYHDDSSAIQSAIDQSSPGDTILFSAGTFNVASQIQFRSDRSYSGGQATLKWTGGSDYLAQIPSNVTLNGLTFSGSAVNVSNNADGVDIENCTFGDISGGGTAEENALRALGGMTNSTISGNTFKNVYGDTALYAFSLDNVHIDNNTFTDVHEGIHLINFDPQNAGSGVTVDHNTLTHVQRHGIEIQNQWYGLSVGWNKLSDWDQQPGSNSHIALSIATGNHEGDPAAENVDVHDNVILGNGVGIPSNPDYRYTAIEIMGDHSTVQNNFAENWGWGILDGISSNWSVENNTWVHVGDRIVNENRGQDPSVDQGDKSFNSVGDAPVPALANNASSDAPANSGHKAATAPADAAGDATLPVVPPVVTSKQTRLQRLAARAAAASAAADAASADAAAATAAAIAATPQDASSVATQLFTGQGVGHRHGKGAKQSA